MFGAYCRAGSEGTGRGRFIYTPDTLSTFSTYTQILDIGYKFERRVAVTSIGSHKVLADLHFSWPGVNGCEYQVF